MYIELNGIIETNVSDTGEWKIAFEEWLDSRNETTLLNVNTVPGL